ncbi:MAG TPA: FMN-binding negative transcriptional regulator [Candidatus Binatia bacterium]|jgi:transcriptional regulator|nr:FMN-binding negative transcriptional regulator [Candidatus Binatia bacterium]
MYLPRHFAEDRIDVLAAFMHDHPLATLVSPTVDGLLATHLPLLWDPEPAPFGTLTGHVARPNPHATVDATGDALAIFLGPQGYVSPSWYPAKREHGKVVPTWNYVAVHAAGPLRLIDDVDWLRAFVTRLTARHEGSLPEPWQVTDAPEAYLAQMLRGIVGVEMTVRRLEGKWKLGQNRPEADVAGTIDGLRERGDPASASLAAAMEVRKRGV